MMENNHTDIESLIAGYFTNSLSEDEMERLCSWLGEDLSHRKEFDRLRSSWVMAGYENGKKSFDTRRGWSTLEKNIKPRKIRRIKQFSPLWYAASLLCIALGSTVTMMIPRSEPVQMARLATTTTVSAPLGAKSNITLPDGSSVWLNAGSLISYSSDFGLEKRDLQLTGEAFFDVKSDSLKPFNVNTSGITVKAYGTRFNVKAYPDDLTLSTTLEEGMVDVLIPTSSGGITSSKSVKLKPKEQLVIHKTSNTIITETPTTNDPQETVQKIALPEPLVKEVVIKSDVKTELASSWKDSKWIISDEPLALFAENLERRYNLRISFTSEELKEYNFSGTFENETVDQILTALSLAAPVNYKFDKNHVVLTLNQKDKEKFSKILKTKK